MKSVMLSEAKHLRAMRRNSLRQEAPVITVGICRMNEQIHRGLLVIAAVAACGASSGCQMAYFLSPEQKKPVEAEYSKIKEQRVGVVVWAEQATLDAYPMARNQVCRAVTYDLKQHLPGAKFVDCKDVDEWQQDRKKDWQSMRYYEWCRDLHCDLILKIDLSEYTTRAAETRELRKGLIRASINIYNSDEYAGPESDYRADVMATYPPDSRRGVLDVDDETVLRETEDLFAQEVARKFYDHEVSYKKTGEQ